MKMINETWLKDTILDNEILPGDQYKIYRRDRSEDSHPLDLDNPQKFTHIKNNILDIILTNSDDYISNLEILCDHESLQV